MVPTDEVENMIKLYGMIPTRANRPHWVLEELGLDYQYIKVDLGTAEHRREAFRTINPFGKVPALVDGDLTLFESAAMCTYLADRYGEGRLIPAVGSADRAHHDQWMFFITSELEQPLWVQGKHKFALPEELRVPEIFPVLAWEFRRAAEVLSAALEGKDYLVGDSLSCADICAAHTLIWAEKFKFDIELANLRPYMERLLARPAYGRIFKTQTIPFGEESTT